MVNTQRKTSTINQSYTCDGRLLRCVMWASNTIPFEPESDTNTITSTASRTKIWPILLNVHNILSFENELRLRKIIDHAIDTVHAKIMDTTKDKTIQPDSRYGGLSALEREVLSELYNHRLAKQIDLDLGRAFHFEECLQWGMTERKQKLAELAIVCHLLYSAAEDCKLPVDYYQGLHDIASVLVLSVGATNAILCLCRLFSSHLKGFIVPTLSIAKVMNRYALDLLFLVDKPLHNYILQAHEGMPPMFGIAWILTWFAHSMGNISKIQRLYEIFLASHPLMPAYMCAALLQSFRSELLQTQCDMGSIHMKLNDLPGRMNLEQVIIATHELYRRHPPRGPFLETEDTEACMELNEEIQINTLSSQENSSSADYIDVWRCLTSYPWMWMMDTSHVIDVKPNVSSNKENNVNWSEARQLVAQALLQCEEESHFSIPAKVRNQMDPSLMLPPPSGISGKIAQTDLRKHVIQTELQPHLSAQAIISPLQHTLIKRLKRFEPLNVSHAYPEQKSTMLLIRKCLNLCTRWSEVLITLLCIIAVILIFVMSIVLLLGIFVNSAQYESMISNYDTSGINNPNLGCVCDSEHPTSIRCRLICNVLDVLQSISITGQHYIVTSLNGLQQAGDYINDVWRNR